MRRIFLGGSRPLAWRTVVILHAAVVALLAAAGWTNPLRQVSADQLLYPACVLASLVSFWCLLSWKLVAGHAFDPYGIFLAAAILFNAGQALLEVLHLNPKGLLNGHFAPDTLVRTIFLVGLGLSAFHLGGLLASAPRARPKRSSATRPRGGGLIYPPLRSVAWILFLISVVPAILSLREALLTVLTQGYFALFSGPRRTGMDAIGDLLGAFLVPAVLFLLAGSEGRRGRTALAAGTMLSYVLIRLFLGSRGWGVMPLVAFAWLWHRCIRPLPLALGMAATCLLLGVAFPLIQATRQMAGSDRVSLSFLLGAFREIDTPLVLALREMGGSTQTVAYTLQLVPSTHPYELGMGYLYAILTLMPNLFWEIHPTVAHGFPSVWLTYAVAPAFARQGGGLGYSFLAEAYLNFGWVGAPAALAVIGFAYGKFVAWSERGADPARLAAVASFLAFFLVFARGESALVVRPLVWYALGPYLGVAAIRQFERRRRHSEWQPSRRPGRVPDARIGKGVS